MNHPDGRVPWDGLRAGNTIRWLEQTGPRYHPEFIVTVVRHLDDAVEVKSPSGTHVEYWEGRVSHASWLLLRQANLGDTVSIKVRCDSVGRDSK